MNTNRFNSMPPDLSASGPKRLRLLIDEKEAKVKISYYGWPP